MISSHNLSHLTSSHIFSHLTSSHIFSHLTSSHIFSHLTSSHISHLHISLYSFYLRRGAGPADHHERRPSAEIMRVGCAKPRRNCVMRCAWSTLCGDRACAMCEMYAVPFGHWNAVIFVFANVSYEALIFGGLFVSFCECLVRNGHFGRSLCQFLRMSRTKWSFWKVSLSVLANVLYEMVIFEDLFVSSCECLVRNGHFGRSLCQFLRISRTKRSFWKVSLSVLRMSRKKLLFWKLSLSIFASVSYETLILEDLFSVFANVLHETLILEDFFVGFCECLV